MESEKKGITNTVTWKCHSYSMAR